MVERWNAARAEADEEECLDARQATEPSVELLEERKRKRVAEWREQVSEEGNLTLLGAYPNHEGCQTSSADTCRCAPTAKQRANIERCPPPVTCPLFGHELARVLAL